MEYINADALTTRTLLMLFIAVGCGYFAIKWTRNLLIGLVLGLAAIGGTAYYTGVVSPEQFRAATQAVKDKAADSLSGASDKAKEIGEKGHTTSAGGASETNEAYKSNLEAKKK